jgi:GntR family transcriptional regulator, transcriptional repressor for pyruvate dehydrogenase complex
LSTDDGLTAVDHPSLSVRPTRRRSLPGEIVDQLLDLIASSEDAIDPRLPPERALSEQLGVSRASLREALSALGELGVVETRGKTKFGRPSRARAALSWRAAGERPERELVSDPLEVRRMLEPEVAARAAERVSDEAVEELESWLRLMEESAEAGSLVLEYDSAFHVAIARTTGNQTLVQLVTSLTDVLRDSRQRSFQPSEAIETALADHREIVGAIRTGSASAARKAMRRHLDHVESLIRSTLRDPLRSSDREPG